MMPSARTAPLIRLLALSLPVRTLLNLPSFASSYACTVLRLLALSPISFHYLCLFKLFSVCLYYSLLLSSSLSAHYPRLLAKSPRLLIISPSTYSISSVCSLSPSAHYIPVCTMASCELRVPVSAPRCCPVQTRHSARHHLPTPDTDISVTYSVTYSVTCSDM